MRNGAVLRNRSEACHASPAVSPSFPEITKRSTIARSAIALQVPRFSMFQTELSMSTLSPSSFYFYPWDISSVCRLPPSAAHRSASARRSNARGDNYLENARHSQSLVLGSPRTASSVRIGSRTPLLFLHLLRAQAFLEKIIWANLEKDSKRNAAK